MFPHVCVFVRISTYQPLRHSSATLALEAGIGHKALQKRLGHANYSTTMNIYAHSSERMDRAAADALDQVFKAK
jgi:integrase